MSQSFNFASSYTHTQFNGADCSKVMLNGVRIWERYTAQRQVWVASGYNTSSWVRIQTRGGRGSVNAQHGGYYASQRRHFSWWREGYTGMQIANNTSYYNGPAMIQGNFRYSQGGYDSSAGSRKTRAYGLNIDEYQTKWIDTSAYQTQNYTAYYY